MQSILKLENLVRKKRKEQLTYIILVLVYDSIILQIKKRREAREKSFDRKMLRISWAKICSFIESRKDTQHTRALNEERGLRKFTGYIKDKKDRVKQ